ncbi:DUF6207 family protein [Streptomyces goshikiensis]|uniref:DUF6207 family protein n=1 Tax=Streptomyces goshikiensis TaxID=1942 RepID=UPI0036775167
MKTIDEQHIAEPGLVVLDITGGDEDTVRAVMTALEERWVTSGIVPMRRDRGEPVSGPGSAPTSCARDVALSTRRSSDSTSVREAHSAR